MTVSGGSTDFSGLASHSRTLPARRLESLTGLRALAALLVFAYHLGIQRPDSAVLNVARYGYVGVSLFYLLSGFVLSWTWRPEVSKSIFYWRRFARVYPLYVLVVLGTALMEQMQGTRPSLVAVLAAIGLVQSWFPNVEIYYGLRPVFWSLSNEAFFYLLFPLTASRLVYMSTRSRLILGSACWIATLVIALLGWRFEGAWVWFVYVFPPSRLPEFLIGVIVGLETRRSSGRWSPPLSASCALVLASYFALPWMNASLRPAVVMSLPFAMLLASAARSDLNRHGSLLRNRALVTLGLWSYALYLVHTQIIGGVDRVVSASGRLVDLGILVIVCLVSGAMFTFVERPFERIAKKSGPSSTVRRHRSDTV